MLKLLLLVAMAGVAVSAPSNELLCSLCVDIVTDLDEFITSDTTEQQIVEFVEQVIYLFLSISITYTLR